MPRILAIDYGQKRVGLAVTDSEQIIASGLTTVHTKDLLSFLKQYVAKETVSAFVVGEAKNLYNNPAESARFIEPFVRRLVKEFPDIPIHRVDERI